MNPGSGDQTVTLNLTPDQMRWLENTARFIETETGCAVSFASIMMRLMEKGLPLFEEELSNLRIKGSQGQKRFQTLRLVYSAGG